MESKVSGLLTETLAPEIRDHVYGARLERDFKAVFAPMTEVNQAHVVMLARERILEAGAAATLARVLLELEAAGPAAFVLDPAREETYFNYEAKVIEIAGADVGGRMHIGRSRNDIKATIDRLRSRSGCLDVLDALAKVRAATLDQAEHHADVIMPGYTHLQPAQPITFGYFMLAFAEAFARDHERIAGTYPRINLSPLGAAAFAGTSFAVDRRFTAELLGFDGLLVHNQDAVASRDFAVELLAACALLAVTWSRLAQEFFVMVSYEFQTVTFPDRVFGTSSIMPQKKNPTALEHLKGKAAQLTGSLMTTLAAIKGTNFTNVIDGYHEALRYYFDSLKDTATGLAVVELIVRTAAPRPERMLALAQENFSTVTDLTDALVREAGLAFREAHHVVGAVVRTALARGLKAHEITADMVAHAAGEVLGRPLALSSETVRASLDPARAVTARKGVGGPAPGEVRRMAAEARKRLEADRRETANRRQTLAAARARLRRETEALAAG